MEVRVPLRSVTAFLAPFLFVVGSFGQQQEVVTTHELPELVQPVEGLSTADIKERPQLPSETYLNGFFDTGARRVLPILDAQVLTRATGEKPAPGTPLRIGLSRVVDYSTRSDGNWNNVDGANSVWILELVSPAATGVRVHFKNLNLPADAVLYVYAPSVEPEIFVFSGAGPFGDGDFWSPTSWGDTVRMELFVPALESEVPSEVEFFKIGGIIHNFRDLRALSGAAEQIEPQQVSSCTPDASCDPDWSTSTTRRSVGGISYVGAGDPLEEGFWCSGVLLANNSRDYSPIFLTANHCIPSESKARTVEIHWLYMTDGCPGTAPSYNSVPRSPYTRFLAGQGGSDFTLLEVLGTIPRTLTWAGWTTENPPPGASVTSIHHPYAVSQRISVGNIQLYWDPTEYMFHHAQWSTGVMQFGSSGAPWFNSAKEVIGQHSGGDSSCDNPSGIDRAGQLSESYPAMTNPAGENYLQVGLGDDGLEQNDTRGTAYLLGPGSYQNLVVKHYDEDWYRITVPPSYQLIVDAALVHVNGNIDLELYRGSDSSPIDSSTNSLVGTGNSEHVEVANGSSTTDYYLRVYLADDTRNDYTLSVATVFSACSDQYEPNETLSDAFGPIDSGSSIYGKICTSSDVDWFKVSVAGVGTISLTLTVPPGKDFDLDLYSGSGNLQARSVNEAGLPEFISFTTPGGDKNYFIMVYGFSGAFDTSNSYILSYTFTPAPTLQVSPSGLSFTATQGGSNPAGQSFNVINGGGDTLSWTGTKTQAWLSLSSASGTAPSTVNVSMSIAGLATGTYNDTITVTATGAQNSPQTIGVTLTVDPPALPTVSGVGFSIASLTGGTSSTGTVTLSGTAPSGGAVVILSSNQAVVQVPPSVTVPEGATSAPFTATTSPVTSQVTATVTATYNSTSQTATLTVNPAPPPTVIGLSFSPNSVDGGTTSQGTVTLSGVAPSGGAVVSLSSNNSAVQVPATVTVSAGATSKTFTATTSPVTSVTIATVTATYNATSKTATLTVNAASSAVSLSPTSLSFGNQLVGTISGLQTVTLTNSGDLTLENIAITHSGDFGHSTTCGTTLAGGASCTISVTFAPTATGPRDGKITVTSGTNGSVDEVPLSGTGTDFALGVQSGGSTSATVNAGQTATYNIQITPTGFSGGVALSCAWTGSQPTGTNCTVSPTSVNLDGTNPAPFTVTVTTTARSLAGPRPDSWPPARIGHRAVPLAVWLLGLMMLVTLAAPRRRRVYASLAASMLFVLLWAACGGGGGGGGGGGNPGTPPGTYALTITATSGSVSKTITLSLTVN